MRLAGWLAVCDGKEGTGRREVSGTGGGGGRGWLMMVGGDKILWYLRAVVRGCT